MNENKTIKIYPNSVNTYEEFSVFLAKIDGEDFILADKECGFTGEAYLYEGKNLIKAALDHENASVLRKILPFTAPSPILHNTCTFGMGDRLGNATPGHIQALSYYKNIVPVFAQQSMRELRFTGRTYQEVLDRVTFSVFKCGYKRGFGADGDHLKTKQEVQDALDCGYTMITLDCSEHINNDIYSLDDSQVDEIYIPDEELEKIYLGNRVNLGDGLTLNYEPAELKRMCLIYNKAIEFAQSIFDDFFKKEKSADFEISIDETTFPTTPNQHFFVANELVRRGVRFSSMAPHYCGDFQKGIDYIGDIDQFEAEFRVHAQIAEHFGYKISVHSGSDKFSVFPIVSRLTKGKFHLKTAGTSWVEAMKCIATLDPDLFREIYKYAQSVFDAATEYYHVTTNKANIPDIIGVSNGDLPGLFDNNDVRQLIHITYGFILNLKDEENGYVFKDKLFRLWDENEDIYLDFLSKHFEKHFMYLNRGHEL